MNALIPFWDGFAPGYPLWDTALADTLFGRQDGRGSGFRAEVREEDERYVVRAEMPGVDPDRIGVSVERGVLTIATDVEEAHNEGDAYARRNGHYHRSFHLEGIDEEAISAEARHGILTVSLPKKRERDGAKPRRIEVK
ncbi:MAG: Hsp20/alpha crystallin family protein [Firmicutes bacterium]|nr:Hsp20/alpha crystallin family protein [Bacillota bacterium]